jgi:hypothetical protein
MTNEKEKQNVVLKDLEMQWNDHFHMRNQTWRTVTNSALLFLGVIGLEIKGIDDLYIVLAYLAVVVTTVFGILVTVHHRKREKEKFCIIKLYEEMLGTYEVKKRCLGEKGLVNTSTFIVVMHCGIFVVAFALLIRKLIIP